MYNIVYYHRITESRAKKMFYFSIKTNGVKIMDNSKKNSEYVIIANMFHSEKIIVSIAYKGENTLDNLYIVNEFNYDKDDLYLFKQLFSVFNSNHRPKEFVDFFVRNQKFYAVFKYKEAPSIKEKYSKDISTTAFDERCKILEMILMKADGITKSSIDILGCATEADNIKVDDEKNIHINYNLQNIFKYRGASINVIFENIRNIILNTLPAECEAGFNKQLHIVLDKCKQGIYTSIPVLIIELKKAEKISKTSSWISYLKYRLSFKKPLIGKISRYALTLSIGVGLVYLIYSKITEGQRSDSAAAVVTIGGISYNGNSKDESDKTVSTENQDNQNNNTSSENIVLSKGLDIDYEDYIVQQDDTVASICENYYKDSKYITAISTFNGIEVTDKLTPGTILKLPNRTAIALYISK